MTTPTESTAAMSADAVPLRLFAPEAGPLVAVTMPLPEEVYRRLAEFAVVQTHGSVGELCGETVLEKWAPHLSRFAAA